MFTHILLDILPFLTRLSKVFQSESADFSKMVPMVTSTIGAFRDMKESSCMYVDALDEFVDCDGDRVLYKRKVSESSKTSVDEKVKLNVEGFDGFESGSESEEEGEEQTSEVELKYDAQQQGMVQRVMSNYVDQIVSNLEDRFVESDQVSKFSIFVPSCILSAEKEGSQSFFKFGMDELSFFLDKFEKHLDIDRASCVSAYRQYKKLGASATLLCLHVLS
jgi:hypothetical protein